MISNQVKNNLIKMSNSNRDYLLKEVTRLGSVEQRNTTYRRNGMLNFGARQMLAIAPISEIYIIGVGGPATVGP